MSAEIAFEIANEEFETKAIFNAALEQLSHAGARNEIAYVLQAEALSRARMNAPSLSLFPHQMLRIVDMFSFSKEDRALIPDCELTAVLALAHHRLLHGIVNKWFTSSPNHAASHTDVMHDLQEIISGTPRNHFTQAA